MPHFFVASFAFIRVRSIPFSSLIFRVDRSIDAVSFFFFFSFSPTDFEPVAHLNGEIALELNRLTGDLDFLE